MRRPPYDDPRGPVAQLPPFFVEEVADGERGLAEALAFEGAASRSRRVEIPDSWREVGGADVRVALLDTGVDATHPDLAGVVVDARDFTGEGAADASGHGTHLAGIVAGRRNPVGLSGVAPETEILAAKVLHQGGEGRMSAICDGIDWAVDGGADILCIGFCSSSSTDRLFRSLHRALTEGVHVFCAAGRSEGVPAAGGGYPGRYGGVVTVGGHDTSGRVWGLGPRVGCVDFLAPARHIWSAYSEGGVSEGGASEGGPARRAYARISGTGCAVAFAAGLAALIVGKHKRARRSQTPIHNIEDLRNHLRRVAVHPESPDLLAGHGPLRPFIGA